MEVTISPENFLIQFAAVCLYLLCMGVMFCDGFRMHLYRKILWFVIFLAAAVYSLKKRGYFDPALILPLPSLLAIGLARYELAIRRRRNKE